MSHKGHYSGGWSDWILTDDQTRYYRERQDENGNFQYEYSPPSPADDPSVPRHDDTGLESAFGNVSLNDPYNYHHSYGQAPYEYTAAQGGSGAAGVGTSGAQSQHYTTSSLQGQGSSSKKGKSVDKSKKSSGGKKKESSSSRRHGSRRDKDLADYDAAATDPFYSPRPAHDHSPHAEYLGPGTANVVEPNYPGAGQYSDFAHYPGNIQDAQPVDSRSIPEYSIPEYSQEPEQSGHRSQRNPKGKHSKASGSGKGKQPLFDYPQDSEEFPDDGAGNDINNPDAGDWPPEEDPGTRTPRAGSPQPDLQYGQALQPDPYASPPDPYASPPDPYASSSDPYASSSDPYASQPGAFALQPDPYNPSTSGMPSYTGPGSHYQSGLYTSPYDDPAIIRGDTPDPYGEIDDRYVIEPSSRFQPGEVFKILWSEPRGGMEEVSVEERESMGRKFYVGFRRFIVVANDEGHCTCVPILTYERRACTKKGVKPQKHGIVHSVHSRPYRLPKEPVLGFDPVRLELDYSAERLTKESRVNYSKLVTVEHNVRVFFIGRIVAEDMDIVASAVDKCWADKSRSGGGGESSHHRRRHGR